MAEAEHHFAPHYAEAVIWQVVRSAALREQAGGDAVRATLESGERFALLDLTGGWAWGYRLSDHMVGYVEASALTPES